MHILTKNGIDPKKDLTIDTSIAFAAMGGAFIGGTGDFVTLFDIISIDIKDNIQRVRELMFDKNDFEGFDELEKESRKSSFLANEKTYWVNKLKNVEVYTLVGDSLSGDYESGFLP